MKQTINFNSDIKVDENQLVNVKIEIGNLPEKYLKDYFLTSESELKKYISGIFLSCLQGIGASEAVNNEDFAL